MGLPSAMTIESARTRYNQAMKRKKSLISDWQTYQKFIEADQWSDTIKKSDWRSDPVTNVMFRIKEHMVAVLMSQNAITTASPVGMDDEEKGKLVTDLLAYLGDVTDLDERLEEALDTAVTLGTAIAHVTWDNSLHGGNPPGFDPMTMMETPGTLWVGNLKLSVIDPANFFPGPGYDIQSAPWHIIAFPRPVEEIKQEYPDAPGVENLKPESGFTDTEIYGTRQWDSEDGMAMFHVMYAKNPQGGIDLLEWAGNVVLRQQEQFYPFDLYPLAAMAFWKKRKSFFGMGVPQQIISLQKVRNKLQALIVESAMRSGMPQRLVNPEAGIDISKVTDEPNLQIEATGDLSNAIRNIDVPGIPSYIPNEIIASDDGMKWTTGHTDAFVGGPDAGTATAAGIMAQHQSASTFMRGPEKRMFRFLEDLAQVYLAFVKTFYTEDRLIRLQGDNGSALWQWFSGTEIADMEFDVKAEAGPSNPMTKLQAQAQADRLLDKGLITLDEYLEVTDFPIKEKILQRIAEEKALQAQMQAAQMASMGVPPEMGQPPPEMAPETLQPPL